MAFNELFFSFVFLPLVLLIYAIVPKCGKNMVLLIFSLLFFSWGTPEYLLLMLLGIVFNYFTGLQISSFKEKEKKGLAMFALVSGVVLNILLLGFFKYYGFLIDNINAVFHTSLTARQLPMPIGISFFTFSILSYLFDVYRDRAPAEKNFFNFSLFVTFFPKLVSGPIVQYKDFKEQVNSRKPSRVLFGSGAILFIIGLAKKVLLANTLGNTFYAITAPGADGVSVVSAWIGTISYSLMLYFDFSGYSDMAIGLANMFGFKFNKNFDYPYLSTSISEFWRRWHISLGAWFRDYIYIPLGGSRNGDLATIRNIMIVWLFTGIWHGANWTFVIWGLFHGVIILLEKFVFKNVIDKMPKILRHVLVLLLVAVGWVFFFSPDLSSALTWLLSMFGIGAAGFFDSTAAYHLGNSIIVIIISVIASTKIGERISAPVFKKGGIAIGVSVLYLAVLLFLSVACMMNSTYSTFLYFQF